MFKFNEKCLKSYSKKDIIGSILNPYSLDNRFVSQKWLLTSISKRMIYYYMYYDILMSSYNILDVGGGFCSLTREIIKHNNYTLLDIMAHDIGNLINDIENEIGTAFFIQGDWFDCNLDSNYDIIIANDLFPNVDQRLDLFIEKFLPICTEIRLSLTYYNKNIYYKVKRIAADEIFTIIPWNGGQVKEILKKYKDKIINPNFSIFENNDKSIFENDRQVIMVKLKGNL